MTEQVAADELRAFIERFEKLDAEKRDLADLVKELAAEARARGYVVAALRKIVAMRKKSRDDIAEEDAILEMYRAAVGL